MPKIRCPTSSASVCRTFSRRALVGETPAERLDEAVHALGRLEQDAAAVGTRLLAVERRDEGLVEEIREQDSL